MQEYQKRIERETRIERRAQNQYLAAVEAWFATLPTDKREQLVKLMETSEVATSVALARVCTKSK